MNRRPHAYLLVALLMLLPALTALAACGTTSSPGGTSQSIKSQACSGLTQINQALTKLSNVNSSTTVGDVKAAQQKVTNALSAIESKIPAAGGPLFDQIKSANDKLTAKLEGYPDSTPIGQTSVKVQDIKSAVSTALSKTSALHTLMNCPS